MALNIRIDTKAAKVNGKVDRAKAEDAARRKILPAVREQFRFKSLRTSSNGRYIWVTFA